MTAAELWWPAQRAVWQTVTPPLSVSEWSDRFRILPPGEPRPGPWRTAANPVFRGPMDSFSDPRVRQVTLVAPAQSGKSAATLSMLAWAIDCAPGPMLLVLPRDVDAEHRIKHRIVPMVNASPRLRRHLSPAKRDNKAGELTLGTSTLWVASAASSAALADKPCRVVLLDEIAKFASELRGEADAVSLARHRVTAFGGRGKLVVSSTPTTSDSLLQREWDASDQREYWVPCPRCGTFQTLEWSRERVRWPSGARSAAVRRDRLAWYVCSACESPIADTDANKMAMLARGVWAPAGCTVEAGRVVGDAPETDHHGYHVGGLLSVFLTWSEVAARFLRASGDRVLLRDFHNSTLALPFDETVQSVEVSRVQARIGAYPEGVVPAAAQVLTAGVDVGKPRGILQLHVVVRAWGLREESWLVHRSVLESWDALRALLLQHPWPQEGAAEPLPVRLACIDSGFEPVPVYSFCRETLGVCRPTKGYDTLRGGEPFKRSGVDRDVKGDRAKHGLTLWHLNTDYLKRKLAAMIAAEPGDPGEWHLFASAGEAYCASVASEHLVARQRGGRTVHIWRRRTNAAPNHYLDAEVYALAAAEMIPVRLLQPVAARGAGDSRPTQQRRPPPWGGLPADWVMRW